MYSELLISSKICLRTSDIFEKFHIVGEGTYGKVYRAREKQTGNLFALKKFKIDKGRDGIPLTSLRELRILQLCHHKNIVDLKEVVLDPNDDSIYLVFEYCEYDMATITSSMARPFSESEIKDIMSQLISGVFYLHQRWVTHRDLKLSNLLLKTGTVKICDFGLGRYFKPYCENAYTPKVVTLWYRAPEVILGVGQYDEAIDMWSVGCIFAELIKRRPLFPADSELESVSLFCELIGLPNDKLWPELVRLPLMESSKFKPNLQNHFRTMFPELKEQGFDLITKLITWDPKARLTAWESLYHPYFIKEHPRLKRPEDMLTFPLKNNKRS
jgi:cyclin-dependent kinase 10